MDKEKSEREMYEAKIKEFFEYALKFREKFMSSRNKNIPRAIFLKAVQLFDYSQAPVIVEDDKFESQDGKLFYRGVVDPDHHKDLIEKKQYFVRKYDNYESDYFGIFSSTSKDKALEYTTPPSDSKQVEDHIMHLKISSDAKMAPYKIDGSILSMNPSTFQEKTLLECFNSLSEEDKNFMADIFYYYSTILGVLLGYDGYYSKFPDQQYCCLLNRGKMLIPQSDADYFRKLGPTRFIPKCEQNEPEK